jgi:hypothetical protein
MKYIASHDVFPIFRHFQRCQPRRGCMAGTIIAKWGHTDFFCMIAWSVHDFPESKLFLDAC